MCVLHDFFDKLPIARGLTVRLNLYLNTGIQITETVATSNHVAITSSVILRATCPFQVSSICNDPTTGSGFSVSTAINYSPICLENRMFNVKNNCRFYASKYHFTPATESMDISSPERTILYNDVVQYTIPNVGPSSNVNT